MVKVHDRTWKQKKAYLRKQVGDHQAEHLRLMKNILKEKGLSGVVVKKSDGKCGRIRPEIKACPNIYEPYEFIFFQFGINGDTIEENGVPIEKDDLTKSFEKRKR